VASGQVIDERLKPKTPPAPRKKGKQPEAPAAPAPSPEDEVQVTEKLDGIVFTKSKEDIKREGVTNIVGLDVRDIPILSGPEFSRVLAPYFGKPVKLATLKKMQREVILYCRHHDRPLVDVIVPNQEVNPTNGIVQMILIEGRIGKITVKNEGRKWFRDEAITQLVRAQPGDVVSEKKLLADIDWLNRNPFREVNPAFRQGDQPGLSDLQLEVEDRLPLRVFGGYEDTGTRLTGRDRVLGGFNWGDAFGLGHQLNYQYTADPSFDKLTAHSAGYVMPLPWRHTLSFFGSYVDINADLPASFAGFDETGLNYQAALRYSVPLPLTKSYQHEFSIGLDFKHNKNDLLFNSATAFQTETDVSQLAVGYNSSLSDRWGRTSFGLQGYYSPGGLVGKNENEDFNGQHQGATADYLYGRLTVERVTRLAWDCSFLLRGVAQVASGNLIPSEQLGIGGYNTVRGYEEREANADQGFVGSAELRSPSFRVLGRVSKWKLEDQLQFLGFFDYGYVKNVHLATDESPSHSDLESVGAGLRYTVNRYLAVRFDYAYRLVGSGVVGASGEKTGSRAHVGAIISF